MGKSLVIKGADFSANGIVVNEYLGAFERLNSSEKLNIVISKTDILALNPSKSEIKIVAMCTDDSVNTLMSNKNFVVLENSGSYSHITGGKWNTPVSITISDISAGIRLQSAGNNYFENKTVVVKVYQ